VVRVPNVEADPTRDSEECQDLVISRRAPERSEQTVSLPRGAGRKGDASEERHGRETYACGYRRTRRNETGSARRDL
jgi:hypothetical protein